MAATTKQIGIIGIGSMGGNIAERLHKSGYGLVLYNRSKEAYARFNGMDGVTMAADIADLSAKSKKEGGNAIVWLMVPGGASTNDAASELSKSLGKGDVVIDASNSLYTDSINNYNFLRQKGISYLDVGCAGGPNDLLNGVSLMVGGDRAAFEKAEDVFRTVCGGGAYGYLGGSGAGHMTKLAHNTIFYGIFPVMSEGVEFLQAMGREDPKRKLDMGEALRLLAASPPINTGITRAILEAHGKGIPEDAPQMTVSSMVKSGTETAAKLGVSLSITRAVLAGYGSMSKETRRIYAAAKKILTGH